MVVLENNLTMFFSSRMSLFSQLMSISGECFREHKNRYTYKIMLGDKTYFIKQHKGVGWLEIIKNFIQCKLPILSAKNEWLAIQKCQEININTPKIAGYGIKGINPAYLNSFILTEECTNTISLETLCQNWFVAPPTFIFKKTLITQIAQIAKKLHKNGINHRDFYLCHFLLNDEHQLYLIDLHRAQIRKKTPARWVIKDLAGLYFSSKDIGLTKRDIYRFMTFYRQKPLKEIFAKERSFWEKVFQRGEKLYRDHSK